MAMKLQVHPTLRDAIPPLDNHQYIQLRANCVEAGVILFPIIFWREGDNNWIIDGHHRFQIAQEEDLPFELVECPVELKTFEEAVAWMERMRHGGRGAPLNESLRRGAMVMVETKRSGNRTQALKKVSAETGRSIRTLHYDVEHAKAWKSLGNELHQLIMDGKLDRSREVIIKLASLGKGTQRKMVETAIREEQPLARVISRRNRKPKRKSGAGENGKDGRKEAAGAYVPESTRAVYDVVNPCPRCGCNYWVPVGDGYVCDNCKESAEGGDGSDLVDPWEQALDHAAMMTAMKKAVKTLSSGFATLQINRFRGVLEAMRNELEGD